MEHGIRIRTVILLLMLFSAVSYLHAQDYIPFPTSDAYWNEYRFYQGWCDAPDYCKVTYFIEGDTIIDSLLYKKIYCANPDWTSYIGAMRENDKKIYYWRGGCPNHVLLYDFNLNVGDSISYPTELCDTSWVYYHKVTSIDSVLLQDMTYRRRINLYGTWSWIEGMGTTSGLFYPYYWGIACICSTHLVCFYHNGNLVYLDETTMPCFNLTVSQPEFSGKNQGFDTYPNPFTTSTTIEYELYTICNIQYTVYNMMGEMVFYSQENMLPPGRHTLTWSPGHLPAGLYYGVLRSKEGVSVVKMIKQ
jgi:hypothetical protein